MFWRETKSIHVLYVRSISLKKNCFFIFRILRYLGEPKQKYSNSTISHGDSCFKIKRAEIPTQTMKFSSAKAENYLNRLKSELYTFLLFQLFNFKLSDRKCLNT